MSDNRENSPTIDPNIKIEKGLRLVKKYVYSANMEEIMDTF